MHKHPHQHQTGGPLRVLAWESTRACTLACPHCRAAAVDCRDPEELNTNEVFSMLEGAAKIGPALIILSGGEPLLRQDLEQIAARAIELGHRPVVSCNDGRLLDEQRIRSLAAAGIRHFSFSMHSSDRAAHDEFVRVPGTYDEALRAFSRIRENGLSFQINTTILPTNADRLPELKDWVLGLKASSWHLFFIVPTGRASSNSDEIKLSQGQIDNVLRYVAAESDDWGIPVKVTCAPQYARIRMEMGKDPGSRGRSCMAGSGFAFVSYRGEVKPCGYFDLIVGNIREKPLDQIYLQSKELADMRTPAKFSGVCQKCRYNVVCGGCRARAYAVTGSFLAEDPNCDFTSGKEQK
ncbi:MAG: radical SAM protein [Candidatus Rifleibacteriota bacterium]